MAVQTDPYTFTNGTVADALEVNARFDPLYTMQNGALDATNIDLTGAFAWSGIHTFQSSKLKLGDSDASHHYIFAGSDLAADRTVTLPLLSNDAEFIMSQLNQTISGTKTFADPLNTRSLVTVNLDAASIPTLDPGTALVVLNGSEAGDNCILTILSGTTGEAQINFGNTAIDTRGRIIYRNNNASFAIDDQVVLANTDPVTVANASTHQGSCKAWFAWDDGGAVYDDDFNVGAIQDDDGDGFFHGTWDFNFDSSPCMVVGARHAVNRCVFAPTIVTALGWGGYTYRVATDTAADHDFFISAFGTQ